MQVGSELRIQDRSRACRQFANLPRLPLQDIKLARQTDEDKRTVRSKCQKIHTSAETSLLLSANNHPFVRKQVRCRDNHVFQQLLLCERGLCQWRGLRTNDLVEQNRNYYLKVRNKGAVDRLVPAPRLYRRVKDLGARLVVASVQQAIDDGRLQEPNGPDKSRNRKGSTWVMSLSGGRLIAADHIGSPLAAKK